MSNVCSKCGKSFDSYRSFQKVCHECLSSEFPVASRMEEEEVEAFRVRQAAAARRQHARMAKLLESYKNGTMFNMSGKIMFCVGLFLVLFCHLVFFLDGNSMIYWGADGLDLAGKRIVSISLSGASVLLLLFSTRRFKLIMLVFSVAVLVLGWFAPVLWQPGKGASLLADISNAQEKNSGEEAVAESPISQEELAVYYELKKKAPRLSHYAVFMDNHDPAVRTLIREFLNRLLEGEYTRAHTRTNGILYVVANVPGSMRDITSVVERLGTVVKADVTDGVYMVRFDGEKANVVCKYSSEVLSSPLNASFVAANISELQCLDSMRIRVAARSLKNADVQVLRGDVRNALVKVLSDPWTQDQDTYVALIDALVAYADRKDTVVVDICYNYFMSRYAAKRDVLPDVADYLIAEQPEKMVDPIIAYWLSNPMVWSQQIRTLSWRVQPRLLELIKSNANIKELSLILRYLQSHGTKDAIPVVQTLLEHSDSIIRYSAKSTLQALEKADE